MRWFDRRFDYINEFVEKWNKQAKRLKWTFIIIAIILILVGICCVLFPMRTFTTMRGIAAIALIVQGIYFFVSYASSTFHFKDPMQIVMGILNIMLGVLLLLSPTVFSASTLSFLFAFLLIFSGTEKITFAGKMRYYRIMDTGSVTFSGVLSIILAVIFLALPVLSILVLNYIFAVYLIGSGLSLLIDAMSIKKIML